MRTDRRSQRGGHEFEPRAVHQQNHGFPNNSRDPRECTPTRTDTHSPRQPLRITLFALALLTVALQCTAQDRPGLSLPAKLYLTTAAADWTTTGYLFAQHPYAAEGNPMYSWVMSQERIAAGERASAGQVAAVLAMSAAFDVASTYAVSRWIQPAHPKLAKVLFAVGSVVRGRQAVVNVQRSRW